MRTATETLRFGKVTEKRIINRISESIKDFKKSGLDLRTIILSFSDNRSELRYIKGKNEKIIL